MPSRVAAYVSQSPLENQGCLRILPSLIRIKPRTPSCKGTIATMEIRKCRCPTGMAGAAQDTHQGAHPRALLQKSSVALQRQFKRPHVKTPSILPYVASWYLAYSKKETQKRITTSCWQLDNKIQKQNETKKIPSQRLEAPFGCGWPDHPKILASTRHVTRVTLCLASCFAHLIPNVWGVGPWIMLDCWEMRCKKLASSVPNTCGFSWLWSRTDLIQGPAFQHVHNFKLKQMLSPKWVSFWPFSKVYKERVVEHVLLLVGAKRIAELLFQEPQRTRTTITQVHRY